MRRILFVCSANYYRSRFAELIFNHLAQENGLEWSADSRGIVAQWSYNPGPIAQATLRGLKARQISTGEARMPLQLNAEDFAQAERVIALYEPEHRPMMTSYFPEWADKIEYWQVPDLGEMSEEDALALIEQQARRLIETIEREK